MVAPGEYGVVAKSRTKAAFRAAREAGGASQAALAEALSVSTRTVKPPTSFRSSSTPGPA